MTDPQVSYTVRVSADGSAELLDGTADQHGQAGEGELLYTLVFPSKVLTLSASEAVRCGLAEETAGTIEELLARAGMPDAVKAAAHPQLLLERMTRTVESAEKQYSDLIERISRQSKQILADLPKQKEKDNKAMSSRELTQQIIELRRIRDMIQRLDALQLQHPWLRQGGGQGQYASALGDVQARVAEPVESPAEISPDGLIHNIEQQISVLDEIRDERNNKPKIPTLQLRNNS